MEKVVLEGNYAACLLSLAYKAGWFKKSDIIDEFADSFHEQLLKTRYHHETVKHVLNTYIASNEVKLMLPPVFKDSYRLAESNITISDFMTNGITFDEYECYQTNNNYLSAASDLYNEIGNDGVNYFCPYSSILLRLVTDQFCDFLLRQKHANPDWRKIETFFLDYFKYSKPVEDKDLTNRRDPATNTIFHFRYFIFTFSLLFFARFLEKYTSTGFEIVLPENIRNGIPIKVDSYLDNYQQLLRLNHPMGHLLATLLRVMLIFGFLAKERIINESIVSSQSLKFAQRKISKEKHRPAYVPVKNEVRRTEAVYLTYSLKGCDKMLFPMTRFDHAVELRKHSAIVGYRLAIQKLLKTHPDDRDFSAEKLYQRAAAAINRKYQLETIDKWLYLTALPVSFIPVVDKVHTIMSTGVRFWIERTKKHYDWIELLERF